MAQTTNRALANKVPLAVRVVVEELRVVIADTIPTTAQKSNSFEWEESKQYANYLQTLSPRTSQNTQTRPTCKRRGRSQWPPQRGCWGMINYAVRPEILWRNDDVKNKGHYYEKLFWQNWKPRGIHIPAIYPLAPPPIAWTQWVWRRRQQSLISRCGKRTAQQTSQSGGHEYWSM